MSPLRPHPDSFVVRLPTGWQLTTPQSDLPLELSPDDLDALTAATDPDGALDAGALSHLDLPPGAVGTFDTPASCRVWSSAGTGNPHRALAADAWVSPVPAFVGHLCSGRLHLESRDGDVLLLDAADRRLIEAIDQPKCVDDLAESVALEPSEVADRLGRLVEAGRLHPTGPPEHIGEVDDVLPDQSAEVRSVHPLRRFAGRVKRRLLRGRRSQDEPQQSPDIRVVADTGRIPIYAVWQVEVGPNLALGMLTACARQHPEIDSDQTYEIRRPETPASCLEDLQGRDGPAILLCSNYVWSIDHNLALARDAKRLNPDLLVIHGGPSTPKYEADAEAFAHDNADVCDVLVRGEGEATFLAVLEQIADGPWASWRDRLTSVEGLSFVRSDGTLQRNPDRERMADLDQLPSPYLTGEFDHIEPEAWNICLSIETNRGCPYGCTFCDWGSMTLSRIRKFDLDRVRGELEWAAKRGVVNWNVTDANFGIIARDVEIADYIAELRREHGAPDYFGFTVAKNTTKHLARIMDTLTRSGMAAHTSLSLQTNDEATLDAVNRSNIKGDHYVSLASEFRRQNVPLQGDLMLGLPGQTPTSYKNDLQFMLDHEITARTWLNQLLPNAPMNDPDYRADHDIEVGAGRLVVASSSFTKADRAQMMRIRYAHTTFEHFGLLRHVLRFVQWEYEHRLMDVAERLLSIVDSDPERYPTLAWTLHYFDLFAVPPLGWSTFYREVRRFLADEFDVPSSSALDTVCDLNRFLMPEFGRTFPASITLQHDYLSYYEAATAELWRSGQATPPESPLSSYGPATFTIYGDPAQLSDWAMSPFPDSRDETYVRPFWVSACFELDSPLTRNLPETLLLGEWRSLAERAAMVRERPAVEVDENRRLAVRAG